MTARKINARDVLFQVEAVTANTWIDINGVKTMTHNPAENSEKADTTTYASQGQHEEEKMQLGASMKIEGFRIQDDSSGALDPGQARCEVIHYSLGTTSVGRIRFRHPLDTVWRIWGGTFELSEQGGDNNDKVSWGVTITKSGATTTAAAP